MAARSFLECSFLIPLRRDRSLSDGKFHRTDAWAWLENELFAFGGATRASEHYEGWYIDPETKQRVHDTSLKYFVAIPRQKVAHLRSLLRRACVIFEQKCIYLSVAGRVEFVGRTKR